MLTPDSHQYKVVAILRCHVQFVHVTDKQLKPWHIHTFDFRTNTEKYFSDIQEAI